MANLLLLLFALAAYFQPSLQQQCSASQLCEIGCCSSSGFCGFGPDYCGTGCQSGCDRKADCDPGTWGGPQWSKSKTCPLNVCCSKFGFCGTTAEFCEGKPVERPSCNINKTPVTRVIGYYEAWSTSNRPCYNMLPESIPYGYYTDIIFAFATINPKTFQIEAGDKLTADYMQRINAIKLIQPDIRIWVAVGGWSFNDDGPTQTTFSDLTASSANRQAFIDSLILLMNKYSFDGIDIDWEYPEAPDRHGRGEDYRNFVTFMATLKGRLRGGMRPKQISLTLPASYWYLQHFDIVNLRNLVDWFNVMTYDMHGSWDLENKWTGPYANSHTNMTEIQDALDLLWRNKIPPEKVTFGMAFYARSFTLENQACKTPGCRVVSGGNAGRCSRTTGVLLHPEIADEVRTRGLVPTLYRDAAVQAVSWGDQWVAFDDAATWRLKANVIRGQCIQGVMVWAMSQDDAAGTNIKALTSAVGRKQMDPPDFSPITKPVAVTTPPPRLCRWSGCYAGCPDGFKTVQRFDHTEVMLNDESCADGGVSFLCCPGDQELPVCSWRGHKNSGKCEPGCVPGIEVEVGSLGVGCHSGYQSACCTNTTSTAAYGKCMWTECGASCPSTHPNNVVSAWMGAGGMPNCDIDKLRTYCCADPLPDDFKDCSWVTTKGSHFNNEWICEDTCGGDRVKVATEPSGGFTGFRSPCFAGARGYCCKGAPPPAVEPRSDDPFGGQQNKEFQTLLEGYMKNPTCPVTILQPDVGSQFRTFYRRSLALEAAGDRLLKGRATDCQLDHFEKMVSFGVVLITASVSTIKSLNAVYDEIFAKHYDTNLQTDNLRTYYQNNPSLDPDWLMRYVFLNPQQAGRGLARAQHVAETFCTIPTTRATKRGKDTASTTPRAPPALGPRVITFLPNANVGMPDLATIIQGILNGDLSLHYARWQYVANQGGPMLELAYWIGSTPGQVPAPGVDNNREYRDTYTPNGGQDDRWVVMHLHINEGAQWLRVFDDGRTYMGVESLQFYHGYQTYTAQGVSWRVDGWASRPGHRNQRGGMNCRDREPNAMWWVGAPVTIDPNLEDADREFEEDLQTWAQRLFNDGYASTRGLRLIVADYTRLPNGDIDPSRHYRVVASDESHPDWGDNMYNTNWVLIHGGGIDFDPQPDYSLPPPPGSKIKRA